MCSIEDRLCGVPHLISKTYILFQAHIVPSICEPPPLNTQNIQRLPKVESKR